MALQAVISSHTLFAPSLVRLVRCSSPERASSAAANTAATIANHTQDRVILQAEFGLTTVITISRSSRVLTLLPCSCSENAYSVLGSKQD